LLLLAALPPWWWFERRGPKPGAVYSDISLLLAPVARSWRLRTSWLPTLVWLLGFAAIVVALARPQIPDETKTPRYRGRGISLVVDVSGSMGKTMSVSEGVRTTRLDKVKEIIAALLRRAEVDRSSDEFGLTVFAAEPHVLSPATTEWPFVERRLAEMEIDLRDNRTEIGSGIALGIDVVRNWPEGESALILFTDGAQRVEGGIGPLKGARIAEAMGVPIIVVHFADDPDELADRAVLARLVKIAHGRLIHWPEATPDALIAALPPPRTIDASLIIWRDLFRETILVSLGLLLIATLLQRTVYATLPAA